jgi:hypothetical protein
MNYKAAQDALKPGTRIVVGSATRPASRSVISTFDNEVSRRSVHGAYDHMSTMTIRNPLHTLTASACAASPAAWRSSPPTGEQQTNYEANVRWC